MSSGSPNESTASRLQRIGRQADALPEDRQMPAEPDFEDNIEVGEEPTHDQDLDPNDQLDHFVELDEPEVVGEAKNCANPSWGQATGGAAASASSNNEPSNFSYSWFQQSKKRGQTSQNPNNEHENEIGDELVAGLASALERSGMVEIPESAVNSRAHSMPPPINKPRSPPRRNTFQFTTPPEHHGSGSVGFYNWQSTKMTVKERISFLFNSSILSDVTFIVGRDSQQQRIPAHRFVLSVGSAVFDAMFNSTLATNDDEIPLPDVEPASFLALLKFLYSDEVQIGPETVMTTLYTAKKYAVPALEKHCVDFLKRHLCADNAFMLLTQVRNIFYEIFR